MHGTKVNIQNYNCALACSNVKFYLALKETKNGLTVHENRALKKVFGP
jgi:hypothetical protein